MVAFQYTKKDTKHLCSYTENVLLFTQWIKYSLKKWQEHLKDFHTKKNVKPSITSFIIIIIIICPICLRISHSVTQSIKRSAFTTE